MNTNKFFEYLNQIKPLINVSGLEKAAGLPQNTLQHHYAWARDPEKGRFLYWEHWISIIRALSKVGDVIIDNMRFVADDESPAVFGIVSAGVPTIEEDGDGFKYQQPEYRTIFDAFDLYEHFTQQEKVAEKI